MIIYQGLPFESSFAKATADKIGFDWVCFDQESIVHFSL